MFIQYYKKVKHHKLCYTEFEKFTGQFLGLDSTVWPAIRCAGTETHRRHTSDSHMRHSTPTKRT